MIEKHSRNMPFKIKGMAAAKAKTLSVSQEDELAGMKIQLIEEMQHICLHNLSGKFKSATVDLTGT